MNLAGFMSWYFNLNLLVTLGFITLWLFAFTLKKLKQSMSPRVELKLHYSLLIVILGLAAVHPFLPQPEIFTPPAKVWSASSMKNFDTEYITENVSGYLVVPTYVGPSILKAGHVAQVWFLFGFIIFTLATVMILKDFYALLKIKRQSFLIRQIGEVYIYINDVITVPFSYWWPHKACVVVPSSFLSRHQDYKIALIHELQHHRHGDTRWVYMMWGLKWICMINPAIYFWNRWLAEIQEFACDEALVDQNKVESQAYARCLVEVAQTAVNHRQRPIGAMGLSFLIGSTLLKRRIEKMFLKSSSQIGKSLVIPVGLVLTLVLGTVAWASKDLVQDRRVSLEQAEEMAVKARNESQIPLVVNRHVLKQLNRYVGTPEGREFVRKSLIRMQEYQPMLEKAVRKYDMPVEILAVPIMESGYQNLQKPSSGKAKGVWQFIPETARNYGLQVDADKDERLNVPLSTDAALRYQKSNYLRFKDWPLALLSYNYGERTVQNGIDKLNTRDAWTLIENGFEGDADYLAKIIAAMIILKNPESVQE